MKKKIKILFTDFWGGYNQYDNYFYNLLKEEFNIEISNQPDYLFYSLFGSNHLNYNCTKICYIGENISPNFNECDYAFSFDQTTDKNYRLPHYLLYPGYYELMDKKVDDSLLNRKFCSFLVNNPNCKDRNNFFMKLSKYKKIDSGGNLFNNIGYYVPDKIKFIKDYKFNICFENSDHLGYNENYTTEKLMQACSVNTLGIYLGNTNIGKEFNTKSFINIRDFKSDEEAIEYIIDLDKNDDKYMEVMRQPWLYEIPEDNKLENINKFLFNIFSEIKL